MQSLERPAYLYEKKQKKLTRPTGGIREEGKMSFIARAIQLTCSRKKPKFSAGDNPDQSSNPVSVLF
jgi:hypothetical protein